MRRNSFRSPLALVLVGATVIAATILHADPGVTAPNKATEITGTLNENGQVVRGATVRLMRAGDAKGSAAQLQTVTTTSLGGFTVSVPGNVPADATLYLTAQGGRIGVNNVTADVELAAALGDLRKGKVVVNEQTTVAAGYALAQFAQDGELGGKNPGLLNAALMTRNLVDPTTGTLASFFANKPNGTETEALSNFNSLASIVAGCAAATISCDVFLNAATDAWGTRPANTWQAMTLLPTNPSGDPQGVFDAIPAQPRYLPVRSDAPDAWTIALRFYGNGKQFNGPGNIAFDSQGRVWANNNAEWARNPVNVCPALEIFRLDPYAKGQPMQTFTGGGLNGAGFGIALDPKQNVWVGNFGFTGSRCKATPTSNSVSEFSPNGRALSGKDGYLDGPLSWPQGVKSDAQGNVWIASCGNGSVVEYLNGNHNTAKVVSTSVSRAFDMAQNAQGNVVVTANGTDNVYMFSPNGDLVGGAPIGDSNTFDHPLGAASDSLGNVWVSNSGVVNMPCVADGTLQLPPTQVEPQLKGSIVQVGANGSLTRFQGGGLTIPWGIAVDGDDNVWVANFSGDRLSHFCGARTSTCPTGVAGSALSPANDGYSFDGLQRNTGVQVDPSGNVWLANNWDKFPKLTDPFGDGLVVFLGMAAPVKSPLVGTPQQP